VRSLALVLLLGLALLPLRAELPTGLTLFSDIELQALVKKPAPDLSLVLADGTAKTLADYRGRWVFLSFGETWSSPSENVGLVVSEIAEELKDRPFDFLQVSLAPSMDDVLLSTLASSHGIQALPAPGQDLAAWKARTVPANYLIDPDGTVVFANHASSSKVLRATLLKTLRDPLSLSPEFASVSSDREAEEKALFTFYRQGDQAALPLFRSLLEKSPGSAWARGWFARSIGGGKEDGLTRDAWLARELQDPAKATDPLRFLLLTQKLDFWKHNEATPLLPPLLEKYPKSVVLQACRIALAKHPEETTSEDLLTLLAAQSQYPPDLIGLHTLLTAEMQSAKATSGPGNDTLSKALSATAQRIATPAPNPDPSSGETKTPLDTLAAALFPRDDLSQILLAEYHARHGHADQAAALVAKLDGDLTADSADRASSSYALWRHVAILDWKGALPYAAKHTETTPQNATGAVIRLVAALRMQDAAAKDAAWQELLNFKTDRKAYLYAQKAMRGEVAVTDDDIASFKGDGYGFVGLLWAAAALEAQGKPEESLAALDRELHGHPVDQTYSLLYTLREALKSSLPTSPPKSPSSSAGS